MKTKKIVTGVTMLILATAIIFIACKKTDSSSENPAKPSGTQSTTNYAQRSSDLDVITDNSSTFIVNYQPSSSSVVLYSYSATTPTAGLTVSSLTIHPGSSQVVLTYTEDINAKNYRLNEHNKVVALANLKKTSFTSTQITAIETEFETFGNLVVEGGATNTNLILSMYYHNGVIKTISRSIVNSTACGCSPTLEYIVNKTGFWCQQDYVIKRSAVLGILDTLTNIDERDSLLLDYATISSGDMKEIDFLSPLISSQDFLDGVNTAYLNNTDPPNPENFCVFGLGSGWGCCGNYSGCCWYWSDLCLIHDLACIACDPQWLCGPQCQSN